MAVQDELLALCTELHASGIKLSYDTILKARGRGSRRDIAAALREWHRRRAREIASASLAMPDHISAMGSDVVTGLWSAMEGEFAELRKEVTLEANLLEAHAQEEIEHLHRIIGEQHEEIQRLRNEVDRLAETQS
ncbi:DNA-binding protein [Sulfitobacter sp. 916]|mgnify:CR=1 FL=1|uniref:DNA-binding protein n=1 Tax=Sulfitobacter sp. 916 TaxID=3368559 RepID=UPI00374723E8|tara:strand:- start:515 stop:919 length:405 start_codon:yes stop_codon:yes gene_type:complete